MDLQAVKTMQEKRSVLGKAIPLACFALACALLIGSLISPSRAGPTSPFAAAGQQVF